MGMIVKVVVDHWRGALPLWQSLAGPVLAGHLVVRAGLAVVPAGPLAWGAITAVMLLLVWQVVGTLRSIDRALSQRSSGAGAAAGYAAALILVVMTGLQVANAVIGPAEVDTTPPEPREPANIALVDGVLVLDGPVTLRTFYVAEELLAVTPGIGAIHLNSPGGSVPGARGVARLVEEGGLDTHVSGTCRSACPLIFVAGQRRTMAAGATLGFHRYHVGGHALLGGRKLLNGEEEAARDRAFYIRHGVSAAFVDRALSTPHEEIWIPDAKALRAAGVLTE